MQKPTFFARTGLLILVAVFFLVPFALRGARFSMQEMKNDVKDWLPKDFQETRDLDEFRRYFLSEQFVLVSWDGCRGDETDERFKLFTAKLIPEAPPSVQKAAADAAKAASANAAADATGLAESEEVESEDPENKIPTRYIHHDSDFVGDRFGLYFAGSWYEDWGRRGEKWLKGLRLAKEGSNEECWYYITPEGDLCRWDGIDAPHAAMVREIRRKLVHEEVEGTLVHAFGPVDGPWYHADPRRLRAQLFKTVTTGPDVLGSLTGEGGELADDPEEAQRRLAGTLFGPDGKTTCIMLTLTDAARRNLHLVLGRGVLGKPRGQLYEIAHESNIPEDELRMGGPPVDNVSIDEEGSITLVRLVSWCAVLGVGLSLICFRSISATIIVFFIGGITAVSSLACVWWLGSSADAILMTMPALVYVLALSGAAHIINYYHDAVEEHGHVGAPETAIRRGWKPAFLCEVTTAIGLVTLVTSELVPIQKFGIFSALGVMIGLVVLMTYLPAALQVWPLKPRKKSTEQSWYDLLLAGFWQRMGGWIVHHHALTAVTCTVVILAVGYGVVYMQTSVNMLKMFHPRSKIIRDYTWLEQNLGRLVPMEIVVRVPKKDQCPSNGELRALQEELDQPATTGERRAKIQQILHDAQFQLPFLERMELAARVQNVVEAEFGTEGRGVVGKAISSATFVRPLPKPGGSTLAHSRRSSTSSRLEAHRADFLKSDYLRVTKEDQTELWRVSLRVAATSGLDYGAFVLSLQETIEPVIAAQHQRQAILREIDNVRRQAGRADESISGSRVMLVGVPSQAESASQATLNAPIDQHRIFASTLRDLLANSRLRIDTLSADAQPADLDDRLAAQDCVVVVGDVPGLDLAQIKRAAALVVDARDHSFVAGGAQQTAYHRNPQAVSAVYTGIVPIVYKAQRMLLDSLIQSTFWSLITITPLLMWIARSASAGIVSMLPNVLPILMVFGGMGWLGIEVDVGSMMTASIALGVAVDDTIHYLNWYREELDRLGDRKQAILAAYKHCATPTIQAAVISGLGLSVFAASTFAPTQRFGMLMLVILWLGVVAELIYFPALLAGPLGLVFKPRKKKGEAASQSPAAVAEAAAGPPQLQLVIHDESADESRTERSADAAAAATLALDPAAEEGRPVPPPHTGGKSAALRNLRNDSPHRGRS
jgi:predicted RND superfamily exporter protein